MATILTTTYAASVAMDASTDYDSLATSSTLTAGWASGVVDNTSNQYIDVLLAGRFKANNTAPTIGQIAVYVGAILDDTNYPDVFTGTKGAKTVTSSDIRNSILKLAAVIVTDATSNRIYEFSKVGIAQLFGGVLPPKWYTWVTHSMVQALNATASAGGQLWYTGIKYTNT